MWQWNNFSCADKRCSHCSRCSRCSHYYHYFHYFHLLPKLFAVACNSWALAVVWVCMILLAYYFVELILVYSLSSCYNIQSKISSLLRRRKYGKLSDKGCLNLNQCISTRYIYSTSSS